MDRVNLRSDNYYSDSSSISEEIEEETLSLSSTSPLSQEESFSSFPPPPSLQRKSESSLPTHLMDESKMPALSRVALQCIRKRKSQKEGIANFLDRDLIPLSKLPHEKFRQLMLFLHKKLKTHLSDPSYRGYIFTALTTLHEERVKFYTTNMLSLCEDALKKFEICRDDFSKTPENEWIPSSKEELNQVVSLFSSCSLFAWDFAEDGCYDRADLMIQILLALGLPSRMLSKQYVLSETSIQLNENTCPWDYHVAPKIKLPNGEEWILDPLIASDKALTVTEWYSKTSFDVDPESILNYGHLCGKEHKLFFRCLSSGKFFDIVLFSSPLTFFLSNLTEHIDHYKIWFGDENLNISSTLIRISSIRKKLELLWIDRLTDPNSTKDSPDWVKIPSSLILRQDSAPQLPKTPLAEDRTRDTPSSTDTGFRLRLEDFPKLEKREISPSTPTRKTRRIRV